VDRFAAGLRWERESFASAFDSRVSEVEAKLRDSTLSFEGRVASLRDEICGFAVAQCEGMVQSTELMRNAEQLLSLLDPKWKLPGLVLSLSENRLSANSTVREIKQVLPALDYSSITRAIWSLWPDALCPKRFIPQPSDPLNGIIAHLTETCGGNVHHRGVVIVSSSSCWDGSPIAIADLGSDDYFCSKYRGNSAGIAHSPNNWVCYDFRTLLIVPTHYSIRAPARSVGPGGGNYPRAWMVEISIDGEHWTEIDRREDNSELSEERVIRTFQVSGNQVCQQIRLVNIGRNHQGYDCLCILAFEVFGSLIEFVE
jgi:hypothetical protein